MDPVAKDMWIAVAYVWIGAILFWLLTTTDIVNNIKNLL